MAETQSTKSVRFGGHLANVLEEHENGIHENYNIIVQQIEDPTLKSSHLSDLLKQFTQVVLLIDKKHKKLVFKLLTIKWVVREEEIIRQYMDFLTELVTANPTHLSPILNCLIRHFVPASCIIPNIEACLSQENIYCLIHSALQKIFALIPLAPTLVFPLLASSYPFMKKDLAALEWYVKNVLYMTTYLPPLRARILELIISKTLKLDTLCPRALIEKAMEEEEMVFEMETDPGTRKETFVDKLDVVMETIFQFVHDMCFPDGSLSTTQAQVLFDELLSVFDKCLLPIHDCCHVQFLMFYMCSFKPSFFIEFRDHLWKKVTNPNSPVILRQTVLSYLASILARAKYLSLPCVLETIDMMVSWILGYINEREGDASFVGSVHATMRHGTFYSACQAVFYALIFRNKQILELPEGFDIMRKFQLEHIITSRLNPLKYCISSVVNLFSSIMRQHQIVYCNTIIERNNRQSLPICGQTENAGAVNPLDTFFPFDRYMLKSSSHLFANLWQEWEGSVPDDEDENDNKVLAMSADDMPDLLDKYSLSGKSKGISSSFPLITPSPY